MNEFIKSFETSYYDNIIKKWTYGKLHVAPAALCFTINNIENADKSLTLSFSNITSITKATSTVLFGAIVVKDESAVHWFSSFKDRNSVFIFINHFYNGFLNLTLKHGALQNVSQTRTVQEKSETGTKMLNSVLDSRKILNNAAINLQAQGQQLSDISNKVDEMHQDLTVAERIVSGMSSWFGRWRMPKVYQEEALVLVGQNDITDVLDLEALYYLPSSNVNQKECVLRVWKDGISILDMKQKVG